MERVVFLVESTGERIGALLNPESFVVRRTAGVRRRRSASGQVSGAVIADDPLLFTGGGSTELELDLLFDVSLGGSSIMTEDVRDLTRPITGLAENAVSDDGLGRPTLVRLIWGRAWNIPGIVAATAERFEDFNPEGLPRRSWLRLRMLRVADGPVEPAHALESIEPLVPQQDEEPLPPGWDVA